MSSLHLTKPDVQVDGVFEGRTTLLVEVKRTNTVGAVRDALLQLAYGLQNAPSTAQALCVVAADSRLSPERLQAELAGFRQVLRPSLGKRVHLLSLDEGVDFEGQFALSEWSGLKAWLEDLMASEAGRGGGGPAIRARQANVVAAIAQMWLLGEGELTPKQVGEVCGVSYPTVAAALKTLDADALVEYREGRRKFTLRYLRPAHWLRIAREHAATRHVVRFRDPSGLARTPTALAMRLHDLQNKGIGLHAAVGGVTGASHYFPELDITSAPRLDLSVYGDSDLAFMARLDAALERTDDVKEKAHVVVHLTPEPRRFAHEQRRPAAVWASEVECLCDLIELGLDEQALDFINQFPQRSGRPTWRQAQHDR